MHEGVEVVVTYHNSHSETYMKLSLHTALGNSPHCHGYCYSLNGVSSYDSLEYFLLRALSRINWFYPLDA